MTENKINYICTPLSVSDKSAFTEASREELRVLLALIECGGKCDTADALAALASTSIARTSSALVFWCEAGVIRRSEGGSITEEFEERINAGEIKETSADETALSIRRDGLADMIEECAHLMSRAALNTAEIKQLVALHDQYALSAEYILMLAAYLGTKNKLTVTKLVNKALKLSEIDIDTENALEAYIAESESRSEVEREFRKLFGIYGRSTSKTERELFNKWSGEYGYFTEIVGEAYDIAATHATRGYVSYADKLLTRWHETGCRTVAECRARYALDQEEKKAKKEESKKRPVKEKETARYGNFDPEEAFLKAIERSYGKKGD